MFSELIVEVGTSFVKNSFDVLDRNGNVDRKILQLALESTIKKTSLQML